jgi:serine/threonine protein kinase
LSNDVVTFVEPDTPAPGSTVGPWLLLQRVDSGSYGMVFLAQRAGHPESPPVALKMARQPWDPRFEREAQLLQRMHHPSVPRYEDSGVWTSPRDRRYPYVVMECIQGFTLYDWFKEQPRSSRHVLQVLSQVARGLEEVHAKGAFHRDVKGDNIRVTPQGRAVLLDFGSGWLSGARPLTDTTAPPGTTVYRPPEMLRFMWKFRRDAEARWHAQASDDLYSLGVTAYRLVTGTYLPPLTETEDAEPRKLLRPRELATVALELEGIILRLLSEDRLVRGSATEIAEALEQAAQQAGPAADSPILPTSAAVPTEKGVPRFSSRSSSSSQPSRPRPSTAPAHRASGVTLLAWLSSASAAVVGGLLVLAGSELLHDRETGPSPLPPIAEAWSVPQIETPDAGVAEEVLLAAEAPVRVGVPLHVMGRPMPRQPFPGQRRPPCEARGEKAINGACWVGVIDERPPCGPKMFDHEDRCYYPSYDAPRQPSSEQP